MPPFIGDGVEACFFHYAAQEKTVVVLFRSELFRFEQECFVVDVSFWTEEIKWCSHWEGKSVFVYNCDVDRHALPASTNTRP